MVLSKLLKRYFQLESENKAELKTQLKEANNANTALREKIAAFEAQDIIDTEKAAELKNATALVEEKLAAAEQTTGNTVADAAAEDIKDSDAVDTPEVLDTDTAISTPEPTSEESLDAIAEALPELLQIEAEAS